MSRTEPIGWGDINEEVQRIAMRTLMKKKHASRDEAREAVDAAAIRLITGKAIPLNAQALLITAATNILIDERRRQSRYLQADAPPENDAGEETDPPASAWEPVVEDPLIEHWESEARTKSLAQVRAVVDGMSRADRERLRADYEAGATSAETRKQEKPQSSTARVKLHRARKRVRRIVASKNLGRSHSKS